MVTKISRVVLFLALLGLIDGRKADLNQKCTTTNGIQGKCKKFGECKPLNDVLQGKSQEEKIELRYQWKCDTRAPKVCCPEDFKAPPPSPVSGHKNLRLLPKACGESGDDKLFSGNSTSIQEFPWMALISSAFKGRRNFHCGGSVISERYILTAAHCITDLNGRVLLGVRVGEHDLVTQLDCEDTFTGKRCNPPVQDFYIERAIPHPKYVGNKPGKSGQLSNDIGLIRVKGVIDVSKDNVMPICLPTTKDQQEYDLTGKYVTIAGWGRTNVDREGNIDQSISGNRGTFSTKLLKIDTPVISNFMCGLVMNSTVDDGIGFRQMCAGGQEGISTCNGDSGGPLTETVTRDDILKNVQFGIVSFGTATCGYEGRPSIYTRVPYYMDWILDQLQP